MLISAEIRRSEPGLGSSMAGRTVQVTDELVTPGGQKVILGKTVVVPSR